MRQNTLFSPRLVVGILLALAFGAALYFRIVLPYDRVFVGDWIKFTAFDPFYHMRLVDNLVQNFPHRILIDPYSYYPYGVPVTWAPFFDWFLAGIIWLIGLGSPTQHTVDIIGVYFPAVLGALTVIPVYFIGKALFNRWAGVIAAGLVGISPGEFLNRSILGFTDHHVAEVFLTTLTILFLILAVNNARQKGLVFNHLKQRDWATITRPLVYSLLAGVFLGIFILTWAGAPLFIFIIFIYFVIQFIIDHWRGKSVDYLVIVGTLSFFIASVISLPFLPSFLLTPVHLVSLPVAILTPLILAGISRLLASRRIKPAGYPLTLAGLGLGGLAIFYIIRPSLFKLLLEQLGSIFIPHIGRETVLEMQSILFPGGNFSILVAWGNFTTGFFLSFISLGILIYLVIKRGEPDKTLLVVWSLIILAATLGQRRFAYYLAVNVALLTGYLSWLILEFAGFKKLAARPVGSGQTVKKKDRQSKKTGRETGLTANRVYMGLGLIAVFFLSFFPNISPAKNIASQVLFAPSDAWYETLSWLKDNTPDPFGNPDFYYEFYEPPPPGEGYQYPETAYGVMAWWDYGHWITRIARRPPNATPAVWGSCTIFFGAQDEASASKVMDELGIRYVIVDYDIATGKSHAIPTLAGKDKEDFYEHYYQPQEGKIRPITLFYPEYYRSLAIRLYNFDGNEVAASEPVVISYEEKVSPDGKRYKEVTSAEFFSSYEEAEACLAGKESDNYKIVGTNPFVSPVPLEKLEHYRLIYGSDTRVTQPGAGEFSVVKIFEYFK